MSVAAIAGARPVAARIVVIAKMRTGTPSATTAHRARGGRHATGGGMR
jgi:hypothetical protein